MNVFDLIHEIKGPIEVLPTGFKDTLLWYDGPLIVSFETAHEDLNYIAGILDLDGTSYLMKLVNDETYSDFVNHEINLYSIFLDSDEQESPLYKIKFTDDNSWVGEIATMAELAEWDDHFLTNDPVF